MKKSLVLAAAAVVAGIAPASAAVTTLGSTMARSCYVAALHREATMQNIEVCDRALQQQPLTVEDELATHVNRGILRMLFGDAGGADADFRRALALNANQPEAWLNLGVLQYRRGDSTAALEMFDRALALQTKEPALAHFGRALAHEDRGNLRAAYADLLQAQSLKPEWSEPANQLKRFAVRQR
jgi:lipoprotein NlpI